MTNADRLSLFYAEIKPVVVEADAAGERIWEQKKTDTLDKILQDVTRHRYGDDAHLDSTLESLGLKLPQRKFPKMQTIELKDVNGELHCIYDKKNPNINSNYIDYGAMACQKKVFAELDSNFIDLSDIQKELTISGQASFFEIFSPFIEIGNPQALNLAKNILKND